MATEEYKGLSWRNQDDYFCCFVPIEQGWKACFTCLKELWGSVVDTSFFIALGSLTGNEIWQRPLLKWSLRITSVPYGYYASMHFVHIVVCNAGNIVNQKLSWWKRSVSKKSWDDWSTVNLNSTHDDDDIILPHDCQCDAVRYWN